MGGYRSMGTAVVGWFLIIASALNILTFLGSLVMNARTQTVGSGLVVYCLYAAFVAVCSLGIVTGLNLLRLRERWRNVAWCYFGFWAVVTLVGAGIYGLRGIPSPLNFWPALVAVFNFAMMVYLNLPAVKSQFQGPAAA